MNGWDRRRERGGAVPSYAVRVLAVFATGILVMAAVLVGTRLVPARSAAEADPLELGDGYFTVVDENGQTILTTGLGVSVGDEFWAEDNRVYVVESVTGNVARANFERIEDLGSYLPAATGHVGAAARPFVGIYHTHGDESYIPSDGAAAIDDHGGVYDVGRSLAGALQQAGLPVIHDQAVHLPHDAAAYHRSRRTAVDLVRQGAQVLFDVHRDTGPASEYRRTVDGVPVTQVMLVVGRQNPGMANNLAFARAIKAVADRQAPGLIRGIFYAHGNYNQDLSPRLLLLEVGDDHNTKEHAENGAAVLGSILPAVLNSPGLWRAQERSSWSTLFWLAMAVVLGGGTYLVIASGGVLPAAARLRRVVSTFREGIRTRRLS